MKLKLAIITILLLSIHSTDAQIRIKMQKQGGVYKVPCIVNGLKLNFVFDTGATNVCISSSEANLMLENGFLSKEDILGTGQSQIADGSIIQNTKIILKKIEINGIILKNIEAIVINELKAPLLLGLSAIEKLGTIQIEGDEILVKNVNNNYSDIEIDEMFKQASSLYDNRMFIAAAELYQKLYDKDYLSIYGVLNLANCYYYSDNYSKAIIYLKEIPDSIDYDKWFIYDKIGSSYYYLKDYMNAELYIQKSLLFADDDFKKYCTYKMLGDLYYNQKQCYSAKEFLYKALESLVNKNGYKMSDIGNGTAKNSEIADFLFSFAFKLIECGYSRPEGNLFMATAALYGNNYAIEYCNAFDINYLNLSKKNK